MSVLVPVPHSRDYWSSVSSAVGKCDFSNFVLFHDCLAILGSLQFHLGSTCQFLPPPPPHPKKASLDFYCVELVDQFGDYCHLNSIHFSSPWTWLSLYLFSYSLIFYDVLFYSSWCTHLILLELNFILFDASVTALLIFGMFIVSIQKYNGLLYSHPLVSMGDWIQDHPTTTTRGYQNPWMLNFPYIKWYSICI